MADQMTTPKKEPAQSSSLMSKSTPSIARATGTANYNAASLAKSREAVIHDVGSVDIVPLQSILKIALPEVQPNELKKIKTVLEQGNILSQHGWECFKGTPKPQGPSPKPQMFPQMPDSYGPEHCHGGEDVVFRRLEEIYKAIIKADDQSANSLLTLLVDGNQHLTTDWPNSTRPDATLHLTESSVPFVIRAGERYRVDHADVVTYFELKLKNSEENFQDDCTKLIYNVHHRFRSDPCVAHVTGITIENTITCFWYFDRSVVLESQPFDFMTEPEHLIHIFLALSRGSRSELGFDPTIKCVGFDPAIKNISEARSREPMERQYEFEVCNNHDDPSNHSPDQGGMKKYLTVQCIANYGRIGIRGRGTSIYAVRASEDKNAPLQVLKDSWINVDRVTEGKVLEDIQKILKPEPAYQSCLQHFLTPDCYGSVRNEVGDRLETISLSHWADEGSSSHSIAGNDVNSKKRPSDRIHGGTPQAETEGRDAKIGRRGDARKRCRTVFVEGPGKELAAVETLAGVFTAIKGSLNAILAMYRAGYIHRDLSAGNIILLSRKNHQSGQDEEVGVLIDLEYAKEFPDDAISARDIRTGTWEFVAGEVHAGKYRYSKLSRPGAECVPWFRNPIHDVESCWLISLWSFFHFKRPELLPKDIKERMEAFNGNLPPLGGVDLPLGRVPLGLHGYMDDWADTMGAAYRQLQMDREFKVKMDKFNYEPVIRAALGYVESMIRVSKESY